MAFYMTTDPCIKGFCFVLFIVLQHLFVTVSFSSASALSETREASVFDSESKENLRLLQDTEVVLNLAGEQAAVKFLVDAEKRRKHRKGRNAEFINGILSMNFLRHIVNVGR